MRVINNARTGEQTIEEDGPELTAAIVAGISAHNETIRTQLAENDLRVIRALIDNDQARIEAHKKVQAELRLLLK